jgi:hypothetical protein
MRESLEKEKESNQIRESSYLKVRSPMMEGMSRDRLKNGRACLQR